MITKEDLLHKFVAKDVLKNKMITVAGQIFREYEKELDIFNQIIKGDEEYIGENKTKNDVLNSVFENNTKEKINSEKDEIFQKIFSNIF